MAFIFTRPRGTVMRQWPDWRLDELAIGSFGSLATGPLLFQYISLFNNDTLGRSLVVWNILVSVDQFNLFFVYMYHGTRGTRVANCSNVSPLGPAPPGQMFFDTPGAAYTDTPLVTFGTLINQALPFNTPSFVIPVGWSMAIGSNLAGSDTTLAVWYLPTTGI